MILSILQYCQNIHYYAQCTRTDFFSLTKNRSENWFVCADFCYDIKSLRSFLGAAYDKKSVRVHWLQFDKKSEWRHPTMRPRLLLSHTIALIKNLSVCAYFWSEKKIGTTFSQSSLRQKIGPCALGFEISYFSKVLEFYFIHPFFSQILLKYLIIDWNCVKVLHLYIFPPDISDACQQFIDWWAYLGSLINNRHVIMNFSFFQHNLVFGEVFWFKSYFIYTFFWRKSYFILRKKSYFIRKITSGNTDLTKQIIVNMYCTFLAHLKDEVLVWLAVCIRMAISPQCYLWIIRSSHQNHF